MHFKFDFKEEKEFECTSTSGPY